VVKYPPLNWKVGFSTHDYYWVNHRIAPWTRAFASSARQANRNNSIVFIGLPPIAVNKIKKGLLSTLETRRSCIKPMHIRKAKQKSLKNLR